MVRQHRNVGIVDLLFPVKVQLLSRVVVALELLEEFDAFFYYALDLDMGWL
jgi:hypothetical protein